jgi:hypothetical protein
MFSPTLWWLGLERSLQLEVEQLWAPVYELLLSKGVRARARITKASFCARATLTEKFFPPTASEG